MLSNSEAFIEYKKAMYRISALSSRDTIKKQLSNMDKILQEVITYASEFSKSLAIILKIIKGTGYFALDAKEKFNPLLLNLEHFHKQASLSALDRIILR